MRRGALAVLLLLAVSPAFSAPRRTGQSVALDLDRLAAGQQDLHPQEARALEKRMRSLGEEARRMGLAAVEPLSELLGARARPLKARAYAAEFIGLIGDPAGFRPLKERALDAAEDPGLRSAALQALSGIRVGDGLKRRVLETALGAADRPAPVRAEALMQLADLGASDPDVILRAASAGDLRATEARDAARAVARSSASGVAGKLALLVPLVSEHEEGEVEALGSLALLPASRLSREEGDILKTVLRRRRGWAAALSARALGRHRVEGAVDELRRSLGAGDPVVVTESAEALAAWRDERGARAIAKLARGLRNDPRFSADAGPEIPALAERIHAAARDARAPLIDGPMTVVERLPEPPPAPAESPSSKELPPPPQRLARRGAFRFDGWPGATRPDIRWKGGEAKLYERPDPESASRRVSLPPGLLAWDQSVVWTLQPGAAVVRRKLVVDAIDLGPFTGRYSGARGQARSVVLTPGETLVILGVRGEGDCFIRRRTHLLAMECPQFYPGPYEVQSLPVNEWWVRVAAEGGRDWLTAAYRPGTQP